MLKIEPVDTFSELNARVERALACRWIGIDTEFLRDRTYYPTLCLIQCRTEADEFCVDALTIDDLSPLQRLFGNPDIVKILHSGRQDMEALDQRLKQPLVHVFDTQIAASFCGLDEQASYASLVESICQVTLAKSHTRTDWSRRPLSADQLQYAMDDVRYLRPIQEFLQDRLAASGKLQWHRSECLRVLGNRDFAISPEDGWKRLRQGAKLPRKLQHGAKALAIWRENQAQARNLPREWILSTQVLLDICSRGPRDRNALARIDSVSKKTVARFGNEILRALKNDSSQDCSHPVWKRYIPLEREQRRQVKEIMAKLRKAAQTENMSPTLLANRGDIEALVTGDTDILLLKGWRYDLIGREIQAGLADSIQNSRP